MINFEPGDLAQKRIGGCLVTVRSVNGAQVECDWFDDNLQLQRATFQVTNLRKLAVVGE